MERCLVCYLLVAGKEPAMKIAIRKMGPEDLEAAVAILAKWNMAPVKPTSEIPDPERSSINIQNSFVAADGDRIIGVCSYLVLSDELAETASLAVDPEYRGEGIGSMLQKKRLEEMKERGIKVVRTEADRPQIIRWYVEKFGYEVVGTSKKKHPFSSPDINHWTILELDLQSYAI